jgi:hypothetical protein
MYTRLVERTSETNVFRCDVVSNHFAKLPHQKSMAILVAAIKMRTRTEGSSKRVCLSQRPQEASFLQMNHIRLQYSRSVPRITSTDLNRMAKGRFLSTVKQTQSRHTSLLEWGSPLRQKRQLPKSSSCLKYHFCISWCVPLVCMRVMGPLDLFCSHPG